MTDDTDYSMWEKAKLNFWNLMQADSETQLDETVREPTANKGKTDNWQLGLTLNVLQIALGVVFWIFFSGVLAWIGAILAILSIIAIVKWAVTA